MALNDFRANENTIIDRSKKSISSYFQEIRKTKPLTPDQEAELARLIHKGGKEGDAALERLVSANLRFVVTVAHSFSSNLLELQDLIAEGNMGLIKAAKSFDETRGFKFISYAVWWIRQAITRAIANCDNTLRIPHNQQSILTEYRQMMKDVMQCENRTITIDEFCAVTGYDRDRVANVISASFKPVKLDDKLNDDEDTTYGDFFASDSYTDAGLDEESLHVDLVNVVNGVLTRREAFIVKCMSGVGHEMMTLNDVALEVGLSPERTRQVFHKAIKKISLSPLSSRLNSYLAA